MSALTGFGMDTLRAEIAALLASLWVDVDVAVPYAAGELLARVRERGTIDLEYRERDVRVAGPRRAGAGRRARGGRRALGRVARAGGRGARPRVTRVPATAGSARLADGARLDWSVADGRRGRRWRAVATVDGHVTHALLLEVGLDGAWPASS